MFTFFRLISSPYFLVIKNEERGSSGIRVVGLVRGGDWRLGLERVVVREEGSVRVRGGLREEVSS